MQLGRLGRFKKQPAKLENIAYRGLSQPQRRHCQRMAKWIRLLRDEVVLLREARAKCPTCSQSGDTEYFAALAQTGVREGGSSTAPSSAVLAQSEVQKPEVNMVDSDDSYDSDVEILFNTENDQPPGTPVLISSDSDDAADDAEYYSSGSESPSFKDKSRDRAADPPQSITDTGKQSGATASSSDKRSYQAHSMLPYSTGTTVSSSAAQQQQVTNYNNSSLPRTDNAFTYPAQREDVGYVMEYGRSALPTNPASSHLYTSTPAYTRQMDGYLGSRQ